ncbi:MULTISPECIES: MFS transporter [Aeromicrobium]|uniref:MFS transporter n=1 Tax=Aeromicrobium TaxID=2040 RepID=UPI00257E339B|nr:MULTISPECIES: MFS transporter [Aeromicrobium]
MTDSLRASPRSGGTFLPAVAVSCAAVLLAMDLFVINLAFEAISSDFPEAAPQTMSWVINAYAVVFAALLVPAGRLADKFGRRKLFRLGLTVFAVGALGAALSGDVFVLIAARGLQGMGAALFVPTGLALLLASSPVSRHTSMLAVWTAVGSVAAAGGPILGGALTQVDWRWIFLISLPVILVALATSVTLTETPKKETRVPDLAGSALLALSVGTLVAGLSYVRDRGLTDPGLLALFAVSAIALAWFTRRCLTQPVPALDLSVFKDATFAWATFGIATYFVGFAILLLGGSLMLTRVWALDPLTAGLIFSLGPLTAGVTAVAMGRTDMSPRLLAAVGGLLLALSGLLWLFLLDSQTTSLPVFFAGMVVSGLGAGSGQVGFLAAGTSRLESSEFAAGTGIINTARQVGSALGVSILVAITGASVLVDDFSGAWLAVTVSSLVAASTTVFMRPARDPDTLSV